MAIDTISFYVVRTYSNKEFLVNAESENKAVQLVQEMGYSDVSNAFEYTIMPNECRDLENMFF